MDAYEFMKKEHEELVDFMGGITPYHLGAKPVTTKQSVVDEIQKTVCGPREEAYGGPEDNFQRIAAHWTVYIRNRVGGDDLTAADVAAMMILMKVARIEYKRDHHDSWVDAGGYAVCGAVCAANGT